MHSKGNNFFLAFIDSFKTVFKLPLSILKLSLSTFNISEREIKDSLKWIKGTKLKIVFKPPLISI